MIMKYKFIETNEDVFEKMREIRINIIRLHNRFCSTHIDENTDSGEYMLDVFDDCRSEFSDVIMIMLQLEGSLDLYRNRPKSELLKNLDQLAQQLQKAMEKYS